jgi:hypothetical protein
MISFSEMLARFRAKRLYLLGAFEPYEARVFACVIAIGVDPCLVAIALNCLAAVLAAVFGQCVTHSPLSI